jgi:membrane protein required for colicin V production
MATDIAILLFVVLAAACGYSQGFMRGLGSLASAVLGIWLALRRADVLARLIDPLTNNPRVSVVLAFLVLLVLFWLTLRAARILLNRLVDWTRLAELDSYAGGLLGLARGVTVVWLLLAAALAVFPASVAHISNSVASMRILRLGEKLTTTVDSERGAAHAVTSNGSGDLQHSHALLPQSKELPYANQH